VSSEIRKPTMTSCGVSNKFLSVSVSVSVSSCLKHQTYRETYQPKSLFINLKRRKVPCAIENLSSKITPKYHPAVHRGTTGTALSLHAKNLLLFSCRKGNGHPAQRCRKITMCIVVSRQRGRPSRLEWKMGRPGESQAQVPSQGVTASGSIMD
jgi:hypothetical protein